MLYSEDDLGRPKVEAAARRLGRLNARSNFVGVPRRLAAAQRSRDAISGADFVVGAVDWPATPDLRLGQRAPASPPASPTRRCRQHPPLVRVGPTYVPGETGCRACQEADYRRRFPLFDVALRRARPRFAGRDLCAGLRR